LSPAVGEQLDDAHGAGDDLEPASASVALGVDFLVAGKAQSGPDPFERDQHLELARLRDLDAGPPPAARSRRVR